MNKLHSIFLFLSVVFLTSCNKIIEVKNPLLGNPSDKMSGRIAINTNNMQNRYGDFTGDASIQGIFKDDLKISSFRVGSSSIEKQSTGMFFNSTTIDAELEKQFSTWYGKQLAISLNGNLLKKMPNLPYANAVNLSNGIETWQVSKSKGITLTWKIKNLRSSYNESTRLLPESVDIPAQAPDVFTVVAIVPSDLQNTSGTSQYWVVPQGQTTFTISPSVLENYGISEEINIQIGSGSNMTYHLNSEPIDILALNTTMLPNLSIVP